MTDKPREAEREAFEHALASNPNARFWNATDAMFWAWQARAALAQQDAQTVPLESAGDALRGRICGYTPGMSRIEVQLAEGTLITGWLELGETVYIAPAQQDAQAVAQGWVWDCYLHSKGGWTVTAHFDVPIKVGARLNAASTPPAQQTQAATDVLTERRRQIEGEGWTSAHDDEYLLPGSLAEAAACYARSAAGKKSQKPLRWPWAIEWWKPTTPRRDLVKAGALILAEIERLDRANATPQMQQLKGQSE